MKYYICIREPQKIDDSNDFINIAFHGTDTVYRNYSSNLTKYHGRYNFKVGYIYQTGAFAEDYIMDSKGISYPIEECLPFLKEYHFKLDDEASKVISLKMKKGGVIIVKPVFYSEEKDVTLYSISCLIWDGSSDFLITESICDFSVINGIIYCYQQIRLRLRNTCRIRALLRDKEDKVKVC